MTATVSYEVHVMRGGRWTTAGIYQDKSEALRDARGSMRKRYLGIRVIEEIFDPERDRFVTRTIYRDNSRTSPTGGADAGEGKGLTVNADGTLAMGESDGQTSGFPYMAMALLGVPALLLAGIGSLFWLGLV